MSPRDVPEDGNPPIVSALKWPPCECPWDECAERPQARTSDHEPERVDDRSNSPTMERLRPLLERKNHLANGGRWS